VHVKLVKEFILGTPATLGGLFHHEQDHGLVSLKGYVPGPMLRMIIKPLLGEGKVAIAKLTGPIGMGCETILTILLKKVIVTALVSIGISVLLNQGTLKTLNNLFDNRHILS